MRIGVWVLVVAGAVGGESWPEFRGPTGQGQAEGKGLPEKWSETSNVAWKTAVPGKGWSSPVVEGGRIWLTTAVEEGKARSLRLLGYNLETGKPERDIEVFRLEDLPAAHAKNSYASPTPVVEGERVYVHFGLATAAVKTTGEVLWRHWNRYNWVHGAGGSPVVYGELMIFSCDGADEQYVVALDKGTGAVRWKKPRPKPAYMAYSTPLVIRTASGDQLISVGGHQAVAYNPATGEELWLVEYGEGFSNVPRPVMVNGLVLICTGFYQPELLAVRPDGRGNVTKTHVVWRVGRGVPLTPSPVVAGEEVYMVSDNGIVTAVEGGTGRIVYRERVGGNYSASPVHADGRLYFASEEGEVQVVAAGRQFRLLARNSLDGQLFASPAVVGRALILRTSQALYRIQQR
jgi:outer membrane protein assembly factor BamB